MGETSRGSPGWGGFCSSRQQEATAFGRGGMHDRVAGISPHMGGGQAATGFARGAT